MITIRKSEDRGYVDHGWLKSHHSFSFADYHDPKHMGFRSLRVINEDIVDPGRGFGAHPHRNMEIVTYIIDGALEHRDNLGGHEILRPGEIQRITAGKGIVHSEVNSSTTEEVHLLQIWLLPDTMSLTPGYEQISIPSIDGRLQCIASKEAREGAVRINQDATLFASRLAQNESVTHEFRSGRAGWLQLISGQLDVNGTQLRTGDGLAVENEQILSIKALESAHFLLFDLV